MFLLMVDVPDRQPPPRQDFPPEREKPLTVETETLFAGRDEIRLLHRGQEYRLRMTKQGKLILTK